MLPLGKYSGYEPTGELSISLQRMKGVNCPKSDDWNSQFVADVLQDLQEHALPFSVARKYVVNLVDHEHFDSQVRQDYQKLLHHPVGSFVCLMWYPECIEQDRIEAPFVRNRWRLHIKYWNDICLS